jgi:hypothetical protein
LGAIDKPQMLVFCLALFALGLGVIVRQRAGHADVRSLLNGEPTSRVSPGNMSGWRART